MRTKSVLKNSTYAIISYVLILFLGLINRRVFLNYLSVELLGYEGLFNNIFSLLSLAELGVGTVITYSLYREVASKNEQEIAKLMMMYKYMYRIIGIIVTIIGLILLPLLRYIITDNVSNWNYIRVIFMVQLAATICTYFLSYRRVLFMVDQRQFICVQVDTTINIISQVIKIFVLIFLRSYIVYLLISVVANIVANSIISSRFNRDYSYAKKTVITRKDFIERNFFKDIKNFLIHKISYIVYGGVDNIVIAAFLGINSVGLVSNYLLITSHVEALLFKIVDPIQVSIGNLVYDKEEEKKKELLFAFDLVCFFLGAFALASYIVLFQPVIQLWLGREYLLPMSFVILCAINFFVGWAHIVISMHRNVFGKYEQDRKYMILSAIANLILSIVFINIWGLPGVILGTVVGNSLIIYGRIQFVFKEYLNMSHHGYIMKHIFLMFLALAEGLLTYLLASFIPVTIMGILGKLCVCIIVPNLINMVIFYKSKDFGVVKTYLHQTISIIGERLVSKKK